MKKKSGALAGEAEAAAVAAEDFARPLAERLKVDPQAFRSICLPPVLLRKYIAYARQFAHPR
jgi:DNA replicative helicase MCM subunit Mcm2 (Cdc46/Mcm family)